MKKTKSQFQDIIPPEKRSIRNIPLSNHVETHAKNDPSIREKIIVEEIEIKNETSYSWSAKPKHERDDLVFTGNKKVGGLSKLTLWFLTIICAGGLFLSVTYFLTSAQIRVETKKFSVSMPQSLDLSLSPKENQVGYSAVTFSDTVSDSVIATGEKEVSNKATGSIVVYNAFDSNSQKFIEGTRFQTSEGLIYKLTKPIVVPGKKVVSGKDVPGSVEAVVVAEKAGADYNIGLSDFTVPGLKDDKRFSKFYARSKTSMTGGESGKVAVVADSDMTRVVDALKDRLNTELISKLNKELPENQVMFKDMYTLEFKVQTPKLQKDKALIEVTGTIKAYVLDSKTLSKVLLADSGATIKDNDNFMVDTNNATATINDSVSGTPTISFGGDATVSYVFNKDEFKKSIAGISDDRIPEISKQYSAISRISTTIKPFWKSTIPEDINRIEITETN
jgi:hypothetical protein